MESSPRETHGVPDSLEVDHKQGSFGNVVYRCVVCEETVAGTENAQHHDSCHRAPACPCGRRDARPTLGSDYGRVDVCVCGTVFRGGEA